MTTINTIEDLVRILDERPEWTDALRTRLLSRELLNLPQTLAEFAEQTNRRLAALEMSMEEVLQRLTALEQGQAGLERRMTGLEQGQARIEDDIAPLKAAHARNGAFRITRRIARTVNCHQVRLWEGGDVLNDTDGARTEGIPQNELDSFEVADLIIEGRNRDTGETNYIAVEISYTADGRDTERAIRNAGFLTRFTGHTAHAVISSRRLRPDIEHLIESGAVRWVEIPQEVLETD